MSTAVGRKRRTMLPLLVVLFLISYGLLTMLVVEQGRTIDSQRSLIHLLFGGSIQLSASKMATHQNPAAGQKSTPEQDNMRAQLQTPSSQVPSAQVPTAQVPLNQAKPQASTKPGGSRKSQKKMPTRPPAELTDPSDMRRVTFSI